MNVVVHVVLSDALGFIVMCNVGIKLALTHPLTRVNHGLTFPPSKFSARPYALLVGRHMGSVCPCR